MRSSIIGKDKVNLHHQWLLQDDMGIHDEAKILSFQIFQALDDSYEELDRKDSKVS